MPRRSSTPDPNEIAARVVAEATDEEAQARREAARILGRAGGKKGGPARAKALTAKRRAEIARKAAQARWAQDQTEE